MKDAAGTREWMASLELACDWMINRAMIRTPESGLTGSEFSFLDRYHDWRGAFRGEYRARKRHWDVFCPMWHGGQGVKALALAYEVLGKSELLSAAREGAEFILRHAHTDPADDDYGLVPAYEQGNGGVNTSAILETLDGLFELSRVSGEKRYAEAARATLYWAQRKAFQGRNGLFHDEYNPVTRHIQVPPWMRGRDSDAQGRPLLDDAVFLTAWKQTGEASFKEVAVHTADRLLADEDPAGNWKGYPPAHADTGLIHPRHAYWWGRPMWMVHRATGDEKYLDCCRRSAQWYVNAMRIDGGLFRNTDGRFKTPSFGHATSGIACAAILWHELMREYGDTQWQEPLLKALTFCRSMQFIRAQDPNLQGAILEKVLPPEGSDGPPWHLRDVGTFFYVQALALVLRDAPERLTTRA